MDQRNLVLAFVLSMAILLGFQILFPPPKPVTPPPVAAAATQTMAVTDVEHALTAAQTADARAAAATPRVPIRTARLVGSIALVGGRFDDLSLRDYHETLSPDSPDIRLLTPAGEGKAYFAQQGWIATDSTVRVPGADSVWHAPPGAVLTSTTPVTLSWDNGAGLRFSREISVDQNFMFSIRDTVTNSGHAAVTLRPYALVSRAGPVPVSGNWLSYEGPIGGFDSGAREVKYKEITPDAPVQQDSSGGWVGFTDKYWLTGVAPQSQTGPITGRFARSDASDDAKFQVDWLGQPVTIAAGASGGTASYLFSGAKEVRLIDGYGRALGLLHFDTAVDWGWFYFLTKPIFYLLDAIYQHVGNFGVAILLLTVIVKILFFPLANRAYENMFKMKQLQPEIAALKVKFGDDKLRLNQEMMALNKSAGVNPLLGCLPILLQIPVFFSLYKVLFVTIEMRHAAFYGWIHDLSAPDPTSLFNAFGLIPWTPPHALSIGAWPVIYCATMFVQQKMQPPMPDPVQQRMMLFMPIMFTFMMGNFPAGLVIYWSWNNTLTIAQQWFITRRMKRLQTRRAMA
jgi:YidC/Oxa1 family membrane protein insertase